MKLTRNTKRASGMTLLELTVVILVLLSLISILFIGARAWKKGSDRAASILTIRNVQQAVRSYANMNGVNAGETPLAAALPTDGTLKGELFGAGKFIENDPTAGTHPAGPTVSYDIANAGTVPLVGILYMTADNAEYAPTAGTTDDW